MKEPITATGVDKFGNVLFDYKRDTKAVTVGANDSLLSIANQFGVGLQQLRYYNNISKETLAVKPGQKIHIPSAPVIIPVGE